MNKAVIKAISILVIFILLLYKVFFHDMPSKKRRGLILRISDFNDTFEENRIISRINFNWYDFKIVNKFADDVVILFEGYLYFPAPGLYHIMVEYDDGIELSLDNSHVNKYTKGMVNLKIDIKNPHFKKFKLNFFERKNNAKLRLMWKKPGTSNYSQITEFYH